MIPISRELKGHLLALFSVIIWGTTFIATKTLLKCFTPIEILLFRFLIGYGVLWLFCPRRMAVVDRKQELFYAGAGITGVSLYFFMENTALTYTYASNVGVIVSVAPFFTAILALVFLRNEKLKGRFFIGFAVAMAGIVLISFEGMKLHLNPLGDVLAVLAALTWGIYSVIMKKIGEFGYPVLQSTRRIFFYGLVFMIPLLAAYDWSFDLSRFANPVYLLDILFLGLGASALCYVTWNTSIEILGAVKSSVYIYLIPVISVVASGIVLKEHLTLAATGGVVLTMVGLMVSESKLEFKNRQKKL